MVLYKGKRHKGKMHIAGAEWSDAEPGTFSYSNVSATSSADDIIRMFSFVIDNSYIIHCDTTYRQVKGMAVRLDNAPQMANLLCAY